MSLTYPSFYPLQLKKGDEKLSNFIKNRKFSFKFNTIFQSYMLLCHQI